MKSILSTILFIIALNSTTVTAENNFLPEPIVQLDSFFSHHILIVEKSTHKLHLYKNNEGVPELVGSYQIATGKKAGNKIFQGDFRTPEGIYHFNDFLPHSELIRRHGKAGEIYGVGAFVLNYPNTMDLKYKKTGSGIWLHSTNDETRIDKGLDSRGCIVAHNQKLISLSKYIELHKTPIVVVQNLKFLSKDNWDQRRLRFQKLIDGWRTSWETEAFKDYISYYDKNNFFDVNRGHYNDFRIYKRAVFARPGTPKVQFKDMVILKASTYALATFRQIYGSNTISDIGRKKIYLSKDEFYNWKILRELWSKSGISTTPQTINEPMAFSPSMRFFKSTDSKDSIFNASKDATGQLTAKKEQN